MNLIKIKIFRAKLGFIFCIMVFTVIINAGCRSVNSRKSVPKIEQINVHSLHWYGMSFIKSLTPKDFLELNNPHKQSGVISDTELVLRIDSMLRLINRHDALVNRSVDCRTCALIFYTQSDNVDTLCFGDNLMYFRGKNYLSNEDLILLLADCLPPLTRESIHEYFLAKGSSLDDKFHESQYDSE